MGWGFLEGKPSLIHVNLNKEICDPGAADSPSDHKRRACLEVEHFPDSSPEAFALLDHSSTLLFQTVWDEFFFLQHLVLIGGRGLNGGLPNDRFTSELLEPMNVPYLKKKEKVFADVIELKVLNKASWIEM